MKRELNLVCDNRVGRYSGKMESVKRDFHWRNLKFTHNECTPVSSDSDDSGDSSGSRAIADWHL